MEMEAAQKAFSEFLSVGTLSANQITFINNLISYLTVNGSIDKSKLIEPPFTDLNEGGLPGLFPDPQVIKIIGILDEMNENSSALA